MQNLNSIKRISVSYCLSLVFFGPALCLAQSGDSSTSSVVNESTSATQAPVPPRELGYPRYSVGLRSVGFYYEEPGLMKDYGRLNGIAASFFQRINSEMLLRLDGEYLSGVTQYDGALQDGTPYSSSDQKFRTINLESKVVIKTNISQGFSTSPIAGVGYRNTFDNKDNEVDYRRENTYLYGLVGGQLEFVPAQNILVLFRGEFNLLVGGQNKTYLSDVSSELPDITLKFKSGSATKVGIEVFYTLAGGQRIQTELAYTQWHIADSETYPIGRGYLLEPENNTKLTSLSVGYLF